MQRCTLVLLLCLIATMCPPPGAQASDNPSASQLAKTPPMGWNSWNKFGCDVSEGLIREMTEAVVSSGMQAAGYQFVNIDDCWQVDRDSQGNIIADPARFPSGMKALADYVHSKGLKLGLYTDAGTLTCAKRPGSLNHEVQDAKTYAGWGIDYVKIDWCAAEGLDPEVQYGKFRDALAQSGRPIMFSICNWGVKAPWRWGPHTGNLWRTTGDISDSYASMSLIGFGQNGLEKFAGPGHWNDPDMLEIGNGHMNRDEDRTHMALWALLAAPLLAGNDLRTMTPETKELLTNPEVLAIDQDAKGVQAHRVWQEGPLEIWARPLADGSHAVGLFNSSESPIKMTLDFKTIGAGASAKLRDLLDHKNLGTLQNSYTVEMPKHGVVLVKVSS
ncbi:MAG TPA: glycoside hydrolase family 27 protein [Candidatus Dormibacteraeota bacterium]|nr:glycoside hydrolase family 27 protein [Candidatus Dormibacteraeota bacterium]